MPQSPRIRLIAPLALLAAGVYLLVGCLPIPAPKSPIRGEDASTKVGKADSRKALRVSRSTRDDVLRVLGRPYFESADGRALVYSWSVRNGFAVWPLCFSAASVEGERTLVLRFDDRAVLRSFTVERADDPLFPMGVNIVQPPLPADLAQQREAVRRRNLHGAATRPATAPVPSTDGRSLPEN